MGNLCAHMSEASAEAVAKAKEAADLYFAGLRMMGFIFEPQIERDACAMLAQHFHEFAAQQVAQARGIERIGTTPIEVFVDSQLGIRSDIPPSIYESLRNHVIKIVKEAVAKAKSCEKPEHHASCRPGEAMTPTEAFNSWRQNKWLSAAGSDAEKIWLAACAWQLEQIRMLKRPDGSYVDEDGYIVDTLRRAAGGEL